MVWNMRSSDREGEGGGGETNTTGLRVIPLEADVPEGGSLSFRVEVSPTKGNCYFAEEVEAFVSPCNQMTFRYERDYLHAHNTFGGDLPLGRLVYVIGSRQNILEKRPGGFNKESYFHRLKPVSDSVRNEDERRPRLACCFR